MITDEFVYSRIGMALVSAQRVEYLTGSLVNFLIEFNEDFRGLATADFLDKSEKFKARRKPTLGTIFNQLTLTPKLILADDLDEYVEKRNILVHKLWKEYMFSRSDEQIEKIIGFCNNFGRLSEHLEKFFKGFIYFIKLRYAPADLELDDPNEKWSKEFDYFIFPLGQKSLFSN